MTTPPTRDRLIRKVLWIVLVLNVLVAGTKLAVGWAAGALSLVADGLHSVLDASSNVVGLVGLWLASQPPDRGHPYGHRRFETIAAVVIGLLIATGVVEIVDRIVVGFRAGRKPPDVTWATAGVVVATIVVNLFISRYEGGRGRELRSALLIADSKHTLSDAMAAGAVLLGFAGIAVGWAWADLVAAAVVSVFIGWTAFRVLHSNLAVLADEVRLDPLEVHRVATSVAGVQGAHQIRSRGSSDHVHLDLHVHLDPSMPLKEAHDKTHQVIKALREAFPEVADVIIHTEPADGREHDESKIVPGDDERHQA